MRVSRTTIIMMLFRLKNSSDGLDAVLLEWDIVVKGKFDYILNECLEKQRWMNRVLDHEWHLLEWRKIRVVMRCRWIFWRSRDWVLYRLRLINEFQRIESHEVSLTRIIRSKRIHLLRIFYFYKTYAKLCASVRCCSKLSGAALTIYKS